MSRPMTTYLTLAGALLTANASSACRPPQPAPLLVPAADALLAPTVTRIPIVLDEERLQMYGVRAAWVSDSERWGGGGQRRYEVGDDRRHKVYFGGTTVPFESFVYDASHDHFIVPGFWAVSRTGAFTFDPPPMVAVSGVQEPTSVVPRCDVVIAVHYQADAISAVCTVVGTTRSPHGFSLPDVLELGRIGRRSFDSTGEGRFHLASGWSAWSTVAHFIETGDVVVGIDTASRGRHARPRPKLRRYVTVRIDARGEKKVIQRGEWYSAGVTRQGEVVGVISDRRRADLLWLDRDGTQKFRVALDSPGLLAFHADGACTLEGVESRPGGILTCYDREGQLRWRRHAFDLVGGWTVDEQGWSYFYEQHQGGPRYTLVAVDPEGMIAWRVPLVPPVSYLLVAGDDLCFLPEPWLDEPFTPELVCIGPRHGQPLTANRPSLDESPDGSGDSSAQLTG
jgi:hypothetical protein